MRTGTGILTRSDVMALTNIDIWDEDITKCVVVTELINTLSPLGIDAHFEVDSTRGNLVNDSYRLVPVDMVTFTTSTGPSPYSYSFNIFGDTSSTSAMNSFTFNGALIIQQGTNGPTQSFNINSDIYRTGTSVNLSYQGSPISETVFNQLYFSINGGWFPSYNCKCRIFRTKGTNFSEANSNKNTQNLVYNSSSYTQTVSTANNKCLFSSIGTYTEFKQGLLGILILLEREGNSGAALTISPTSWSPTAAASSKTFTASNLSGSLSVSSKPTWATVSISGSTVTVSITQNTGTSIRSGTVKLAGYGTDDIYYNLTISISQAKASIGPSISPTTKTVSSDAQTINVTISNVTSISSVTSTNNAIAYPVYAASNVFNRQIQIYENTSTSARGATVTYTVIDLNGATKSLTVTITQNGKTSTAQPTIRLSGETEWIEDTTTIIQGYHVYNSGTTSNSSWKILTLEVRGYGKIGNLDIYIRSYGEKNYDYAIAYELDYIPEPSTYSDLVYTAPEVVAHTRGNQQSGTTLSSYTKVSYTIPDDNLHTISVVYRKDYGGTDGDDAAYVAVPNKYMA